MDNLTLLTEGSKIYSEKRKRKNNQIPEIVFDETARREYLTGFHKRKLERQAKAKKIALEREKKEKAEIKKAESQRRQIEEKLAATQAIIDKANDIDNDDNDDDESEEDTKKNQRTRISEYKTPQMLTTVTL
ncbi:21498_t:CDS:2 [Dentiscutata erythropus]|uniref:21498_t:CDS:1 n=1 Tax=Dentiscutata erythropus TaxID=1348616 RepID=A0A9N9H5W1_9GLOM|nr:21498_t:CDS:2 [Dentiscutata erythropus]